MKKFILPLAVLAGCYAFFFAYLDLSYGSLPPRVASHFDLAGQPNGWMTRDELVAFIAGMGILLPLLIVGMMAGAGRIPVSFVNLPNRDYWLAPERRRSTSLVLLRYALWFASMNVLFLAGLHALIVFSNSGDRPHLNGGGMLFVLGGFLLGTMVWCVLLRRRFARKP